MYEKILPNAKSTSGEQKGGMRGGEQKTSVFCFI